MGCYSPVENVSKRSNADSLNTFESAGSPDTYRDRRIRLAVFRFSASATQHAAEASSSAFGTGCAHNPLKKSAYLPLPVILNENRKKSSAY